LKDGVKMAGKRRGEDIVSAITIEHLGEIGALYLLKPIAEALGVREAVDAVAPTPQGIEGFTCGQVIEQLVLNRIEAKYPLHKIEEWAEKKGIEHFFQMRPEHLNSKIIGQSLTAIADHLTEIAGLIFPRIRAHVRLDLRQAIWNTTVVSFEEAPEDYDERGFFDRDYDSDGPKNKKSAALELLYTAREGIPLTYRLQDKKLTGKKRALPDFDTLRQETEVKDFVVLGNRTLLSKANLAEMQRKKIHFLGPLSFQEKELILSFPETAFNPLDCAAAKNEVLSAVDTYLEFEDKEEKHLLRAIVVKSEKLSHAQKKTVARDINYFTGWLARLDAQIQKGVLKDRDKVEERLLDAFRQEPKMRSLIKVDLTGEDGNLQLRWQVDSEKQTKDQVLKGKYVLVTDLEQMDYGAADIITLYKTLHKMEARYREVRNNIKVEPDLFQSDDHVRSLAFVYMLALMIYSMIDEVCQRQEIATCARNLIERMERISIVDLKYGGRRIRQVSNLEKDKLRIFSLLNLKTPEI
jgi:transposase